MLHDFHAVPTGLKFSSDARFYKHAAPTGAGQGAATDTNARLVDCVASSVSSDMFIENASKGEQSSVGAACL